MRRPIPPCSKCGAERFRRRTKKDGFHHLCQVCARKARGKAFTAAGKEHARIEGWELLVGLLRAEKAKLINPIFIARRRGTGLERLIERRDRLSMEVAKAQLEIKLGSGELDPLDVEDRFKEIVGR